MNCAIKKLNDVLKATDLGIRCFQNNILLLIKPKYKLADQ